MLDPFISRDWSDNHRRLANDLGSLFNALRDVAEIGARQRFAAPWRGKGE